MNEDNEKISKQVADLYASGKNSSELSKQFGISVPTVLRCIRGNGVAVRSISEAKRKYQFNEDYFAVIDSHEKAQILGFIAADGCVSSVRNTIEITIQLRDEAYLQHIKKCLDYTGPLTYCTKTTNKTSKERSYVRLLITSSKIKQDLIRLGVSPRKSLNLEFPTSAQVPDEFISSFILGFMEGDGGITIAGEKAYNANVKICVTKSFGKRLAHIVQERLNINSSMSTPKASRKSGSDMHVLGVGGGQQLLKLCAWLYENSVFRMQRKYDRYLKLLSYYGADGNRIKEEGWSERMAAKHKVTHAKNGTWAGRVPKKTYYFMSPTGQVTQIKRLCQFARELGLVKSVFYAIANKKPSHHSYYGWRLATPDEIAAAISTNSLVIKDYSQPVAAQPATSQPTPA